MGSVVFKLDAERAEVDLLLNSRRFARTNNLGRFLSFVCEKYFEGSASEIKEYSIGVEALGRPSEFDPQVDCIVRVTAHNLRKQLELYYATEGASRPVHVFLPAGHYVPQFVHQEGSGGRAQHSSVSSVPLSSPDVSASTPSDESASIAGTNGKRPGNFASGSGLAALQSKFQPGKILLLLVLVSLSVFLAFSYFFRARASKPNTSSRTIALAAPPNISTPGIHALVGAERAPYVDRAGLTWQGDRFCAGGNPFSVAARTILGTEDAELFQSGRKGLIRCGYPVPPGTYEVHLLFAETWGLQEASRSVSFSINGGATQTLDVVDDAGGDDIATTKVYTDVEPGKDGMIHIDFLSPESFVNAIEITPSTLHRMLPVRVVTGHSPYRESSGNLWVSDRYFFGGRLSRFGGDLSQMPNNGIYEWHRFGHFRYVIPVATGAKYTLRLYFLEHWFGVQNGGIGGAGSRVFDVSCNGTVLLKDFDIYREAGSQPLVKTFSHIAPTAQGKIELYFTPVVNYPSLSAIEIVAE